MIRTVGMTLVFGAVLVTAGCLEKETTHTIYLAPDGGASWVVSEFNVHSDEKEADKRISEEQRYIGPALLGAHGAARGLAALEPQGPVRTTILRDERPFHVVTDARFAAVDRLLQRFFVQMGIRTSASLVREGSRLTLRVQFDFSRALAEHETEVSELADVVERSRFVLTEGCFDAVSGFEVSDGVSATLSSDWMDRLEKAYEGKGAIEFALSWTVG
jgi:hypothetical protein